MSDPGARWPFDRTDVGLALACAALLAMGPVVLQQMEGHIAKAEATGTDEAKATAYESLKQIVAWLRAGTGE